MTIQKLPIAKKGNTEEFIFNSVNVRIIIKENEPLFCLADVCKVLELTSSNNIVNQIKEEFSIPMLNMGMVSRPDGSKISATFITESQLYFVMFRSRSELAKPFRQWVVNDVLPNIRKHGKYEIDEQKTISDETKQLKNISGELLSLLRLEIENIREVKEDLRVIERRYNGLIELQRKYLSELKDATVIQHFQKVDEFLDKYSKSKDARNQNIQDVAYGKTAEQIVSEVKKTK